MFDDELNEVRDAYICAMLQGLALGPSGAQSDSVARFVWDVAARLIEFRAKGQGVIPVPVREVGDDAMKPIPTPFPKMDPSALPPVPEAPVSTYTPKREPDDGPF